MNYILNIIIISALLFEIIDSEFRIYFLRICQFTSLLPLLILFKKDLNLSRFHITYISIGILIFTIICTTINGEYYYLDLVYPFIFIGISICYIMKAHCHANLIYYFVSTYFILMIASDVPPREWVAGSENQISKIVLACLFINILNKNKKIGFVDFLNFILACSICVISGSRSGTIVAFTLLILLLFLYGKLKHISYYITVLLFAVILFGDQFYYSLSNFLSDMRNDDLTIGPRAFIAKSYIESINIKQLLFGNNDILKYFLDYYGLTSHNSYLSWHAHWGIAALVILFIHIKFIFKLYFNEKLYFIIVICLFLRSLSDNYLYTGSILFTIPLLIIFVKVDNKYFIK